MPRCMNCDGPFHSATGCQFSETAALCHACTHHFWSWVVKHTNKPCTRRGKKMGEENFYEVAARTRPV
jgi:hypothetical protein